MIDMERLERVLGAQISAVLMSAYAQAHQAADSGLMARIEEFPARLREVGRANQRRIYQVVLVDPRLAGWQIDCQYLMLTDTEARQIPRILGQIRDRFRASLTEFRDMAANLA